MEYTQILIFKLNLSSGRVHATLSPPMLQVHVHQKNKNEKTKPMT